MDANPGMPVEEILNIMDSFVGYTSNLLMCQATVQEQSEFCVSQGHASFSETGSLLFFSTNRGCFTDYMCIDSLACSLLWPVRTNETLAQTHIANSSLLRNTPPGGLVWDSRARREMVPLPLRRRCSVWRKFLWLYFIVPYIPLAR